MCCANAERFLAQRRNGVLVTLAGSLVRAFGDIERMSELYDDAIVWYLPASVGVAAGPHRGKEAVLAFNNQTWGGGFYLPTGVEVKVHDELEQGDLSVARLTYSATVASTGERYDNEYVVLVRASNGKICEVHEHLDTLKVMQYEGLRPFLPPL